MPRLSWRARLFAWGASWLGWAVLTTVARSSRIRRVESEGFRQRLSAGLPIIYAFWHRYQALLLYDCRGSGVRVLVSRSKDGEIVARGLHRFGYCTARGSSSRGGVAAFLQLEDTLRQGGAAALTPDGPRGPLRSVQPGVLALAARTGVPIAPVAWAGTRAWELSSWDRFLIPKPFGRYATYYGEPIFYSGSGPSEMADLTARLNAAEERAAQELSQC